MNLPQLRSKPKFLFIIVLWLGCFSQVYAQQFDQSYEKWKAQQQARDQQLAKQPNNNYYLSRPSQQQTNKQLSSSVNISGDKISLNQANLAQLQSLSGVGVKKGTSHYGVSPKEWWF